MHSYSNKMFLILHTIRTVNLMTCQIPVNGIFAREKRYIDFAMNLIMTYMSHVMQRREIIYYVY